MKDYWSCIKKQARGCRPIVTAIEGMDVIDILHLTAERAGCKMDFTFQTANMDNAIKPHGHKTLKDALRNIMARSEEKKKQQSKGIY